MLKRKSPASRCVKVSLRTALELLVEEASYLISKAVRSKNRVFQNVCILLEWSFTTLTELRRFWMFQYKHIMKPGGLQYGSCPQLEKRVPEESSEERALRHLTSKYDSYHGLLLQQQNQRRVSSLDGSETATDVSSSSSSSTAEERLQVTEQDRLQVETFFRGLKTQVFVSGSLANLYWGSTSCEGQWELSHMGIPVLVLDSGETRSRNKRRIQILLAERGTCFTLWQDTIDNLSSYRVSGRAFHTMHLSSDHSVLVGLSFDSPVAADEMWRHVERLTACPENISLSVPGRRGRKPRRTPKSQPLPAKSHISQPCCFQHVTSVDVADRMRYLSLRALVPGLQDKTVTDL